MQGATTEAEYEFRAAVSINPALAEGWCGLGDVLQVRGLLDEAERCCSRALELRPDYPDALNNLATIAKVRGRFDAAKVYCQDVLRIQPSHVGALNNLGSVAVKEADFAGAEAVYRTALRIDPSRAVTRFNLSTTLLMLGNYEEGFELYESRFGAFPRPRTPSPVLNERLHARRSWQGEPLVTRRLLIWAEQGLGDSIMMLRYLPHLRARGVHSATVYCDVALGKVVESMAVVEHVVTAPEAAGEIDFDVHCPMMSLPRAFGTSINSIPSSEPYIGVPSSTVAMWRERLTGAAPRVGFAWAGSKSLEDDARRSISLEQFEPLLSLDGFEFVSLQKGYAAEQWREANYPGGQYIDDCRDFLDSAALIMNLDLVISVDTAVAHLAGALGLPIWLLNRFGSEWRWGFNTATSPWYPTMTIFSQRAPSTWRGTIESVGRELEDRFRNHAPLLYS